MPRCSTRTLPVSAAAQSQARARDRTLPRVAGLPIAVGRGAGALCITPARPHRSLQPLRQRRRGPSWELWFRPSPHSPRRRAADYNSRQASRRPREPERWGVSAVSAGGLGRDAAAGWPGWRLLSSRGPGGRPPRVLRPFDWPAGWLTDSVLLRSPEPPRPAGGSQTSGQVEGSRRALRPRQGSGCGQGLGGFGRKGDGVTRRGGGQVRRGGPAPRSLRRPALVPGAQRGALTCAEPVPSALRLHSRRPQAETAGTGPPDTRELCGREAGPGGSPGSRGCWPGSGHVDSGQTGSPWPRCPFGGLTASWRLPAATGLHGSGLALKSVPVPKSPGVRAAA